MKDDEAPLCSHCRGSGMGYSEGDRCPVCGGGGEMRYCRQCGDRLYRRRVCLDCRDEFRAEEER